MIKQILFAASVSTVLTGSALAENTLSTKATCTTIQNSVATAVKASPSKVLEITSKTISQNPNCVCEIVKAAIKATDADKNLVASIVETAIIAVPDQMRLIGQCAMAVAPDAMNEVQSVMDKYTAKGEGSSYSAKGYSAKGGDQAGGDGISPNNTQEPAMDPLNFPNAPGSGSGPLGGGDGGSATIGDPLFFDPVGGGEIIVIQNPTTETGGATVEAN